MHNIIQVRPIALLSSAIAKEHASLYSVYNEAFVPSL